MEIRTALPTDAAALAAVEAECFPAAEAASLASITARVAAYPKHFWLLFDGETLVGFVNGMVTDEPDLRDEMYDDASLHNENGAWQMIFGLDTIPAYRRRGCAGMLTAALREKLPAQGLTPMLYADAGNPSSNRAYQKIGMEARGQVTEYRWK